METIKNTELSQFAATVAKHIRLIRDAYAINSDVAEVIATKETNNMAEESPK